MYPSMLNDGVIFLDESDRPHMHAKLKKGFKDFWIYPLYTPDLVPNYTPSIQPRSGEHFVFTKSTALGHEFLQISSVKTVAKNWFNEQDVISYGFWRTSSVPQNRRWFETIIPEIISYFELLQMLEYLKSIDHRQSIFLQKTSH